MTINQLTYQQKLTIFTEQVTVYPVSCEKLANGKTDLEWLEAVLQGGAKIIQLRDKESSDRELLAKALVFREKTLEAGAIFMVNNRLDIALLANADGLHLGNDDIPVQEARRLGKELIIGISANSQDQAKTAKERGATYYNIGPIYPTKTKAGLTNFVGEEAITTFSQQSSLPFTVMGGVKKENIEILTKLGARRLAVVTALTKAADIKSETAYWHSAITKNLGK